MAMTALVEPASVHSAFRASAFLLAYQLSVFKPSFSDEQIFPSSCILNLSERTSDKTANVTRYWLEAFLHCPLNWMNLFLQSLCLHRFLTICFYLSLNTVSMILTYNNHIRSILSHAITIISVELFSDRSLQSEGMANNNSCPHLLIVSTFEIGSNEVKDGL